MGIFKLIKNLLTREKPISLLANSIDGIKAIKSLSKRSILRKIKKNRSKHYLTTTICVYEASIEQALKDLKLNTKKKYYLSEDICVAITEKNIICLISSADQLLTNSNKLDQLNWILKKSKKLNIIDSNIIVATWLNQALEHSSTLYILEKLFKVHSRYLENHQQRMINTDQAVINNYWKKMVDVRPQFLFKDNVKYQLDSYYQRLTYNHTSRLIERNETTNNESSNWLNAIDSILTNANDNVSVLESIQRLCKYYKITNLFCLNNYNLKASSQKKKKFDRLSIIAIIFSLIMFGIFLSNQKKLEQQRTNLKINWQANSIKQLEQIYYKKVNNYHTRLVFDFLYPKLKLYPKLNKQFIVELKSRFLNSDKYAGDSIQKRLFLYLTFLAFNNQSIKTYIDRNLDNWAYALGISNDTLKIILNTEITKLIKPINFKNNQINELITSLKNRNLNQLQWIKNFVSDNQQNLTLKTLNQLLVDYRYQNIINQLLVQLFNSKIVDLDDISNVNQTIFTKINENYSVEYSTVLDDIEKIINKIDLKKPDDFLEFIDVLESSNKIINSYFKSSNLPVDSRNFIIKLVQQALINTMFEKIYIHNYRLIPLLDDDFYKTLISHADFNRREITTPSAYTKATITEQLLPKLKIYSQLIKTYKTLGIKTSTLEQLKTNIITGYINEYIKEYKLLFLAIWPNKVTDEQLAPFLIDISSDQSPFLNTLDYIQTNTTFDFKHSLLKQFMKISDEFNSLNSLLKSKEFSSYQNSLKNIAKLLEDKSLANYSQLYKALNNKQIDNLKLSPEITGVKYIEEQTALNPIFKSHLLSPINIIKKYLLVKITEMVQDNWIREVSPQLDKLNQSFPFNNNSNYILSNQQLSDLIGNNGTLYLNMRDLLLPFIESNSRLKTRLPKNILTIIKPLFLQFNTIKLLQNALWDKNNKPKAIQLEIKALPFNKASSKMAISFININQAQVQGLNTKENATIILNYQWNLKPTVTIGWFSTDDQLYQNSFDGHWSLIKALNAAKANKNIYSWNIKDDQQYQHQISFDISNNFLNILKQMEDENA